MTREHARRERTADGVIHAIGIVAAASCAPLLVVLVMARGELLPTVTAIVYAITLVTTLAISGAYNMTADGRAKERLRPYDHASIFLLIAGTYTPFSLVAIGGTLGRILCASVWLVAVVGAVLKFLHRRRYERVFITLYVALGWAGIPAIGILMVALPASAFALLLMGGFLYTAGIAFHLWDRLPYSTAIWHALVLTAAICHYLAVLIALAPGIVAA
jgi:hemolysin III